MTRVVRLLRGLGALGLLAGVLGGVPWALWHYVGWPLPHSVPSFAQVEAALGHHGIPDAVLIKALACAVWVTWAVLAASVLVEVHGAIRGRGARRLRFAGPLQPVVGQLVAAVVLGVMAGFPRPVPGTGGAARLPASVAVARPRPGTPAFSLVDDTRLSRGSPGTNGHGPSPAPSVPTRTYVVQGNDTLWGIAQRELGDPLRWEEIYTLNEGRAEPGGRVLDSPHWIYPGWTLLLPTAGSPAPAASSPSPPAASPQVPGTSPSASAPRTPASPPTSAPVPPDSTAGHSATGRDQAAGAPAQGRHVAEHAPAPVRLPSGSVVGGSFAAGVLSALALGRLRRRRAYRYRSPEPGRDLGASPLRPMLRQLVEARRQSEDTLGGDPSMSLDDTVPALAGDDPERRERPDLLDVGTRGGEPVSILLSDVAGVTFTGRNADGVVRAWITALLVRGGPIAAEVLTTQAIIERLVPGVGGVPGLRVVDGADKLLPVLEVAVIARTRRLDRSELPDVLAYRRAHPEDPFPSLLAVIDDVPAAGAPRWRATLGASARLGLGVVFLDATDAAEVEVHLDDDQVVSDVAPPELAGHLLGTQMFALGSDEARDVLASLAEAEIRPSSDDERGDLEGERPAISLPTAGDWPEPPAPVGAAGAPIAVSVLGDIQITVGGEVVDSGLRSVAKELLSWYALRPEGASVEVAVEALWPDTDPKLVHRQFWTAAGNLRSRLRRGTEADLEVLVQVGEVYRLEAEAISCDLWSFQHALADAARAEDDLEARDALRVAVEAYRGDLVRAADWHWIEPVREDLHRRSLDAHLRLAELEEHLGTPRAAEAVLERAIELDQYGEEPYRRLMALQARSGHHDAVRATWRLLQRRLAELDVDPEPATLRLHRALLAEEEEQPAGRHRAARLQASRPGGS